ncbi:hypothetical protein [Chitinimonas sp. JJ19]|uniref:hypothetical protein n=1 Tax=Chitinimonas sp. JJ19 TaxID=3109352 RepID=UPI0030019E1C
MDKTKKQDKALQQWSIWPPALLALVLLTLGLWVLRSMGVASPVQLGYVLLALVLTWLLLPYLAYKTWCEGEALCWRWGQLNHGPVQRLALADIAAVEVAALPDKPTRPVRREGSEERHGGNFTPDLNQGVKLQTRDGRTIWLCLPQPAQFAKALRALLATGH